MARLMTATEYTEMTDRDMSEWLDQFESESLLIQGKRLTVRFDEQEEVN